MAAWLVSLMVALPLLAAPFRAFVGFRSDTHASALGWRRVPYLWIGTLLQFGGLAIMPFALLVLTGDGQLGMAWLGHLCAGLAFLLVGAGLQTTQTAGLALATDLSTERTRPRVVALMYVMLLLGMVGGGALCAALLADFSDKKLVQVVQGVAVLSVLLNLSAAWKQEARRKGLRARGTPAPAFMPQWRLFIAQPQARRFLWATFLGTAAFNMQDIVLEPYGGEILGLSVSATSALTALMAAGALLAFLISARALARGIDPLRLSAMGALAGLPAFSAVVFAAPAEAAWLFRAGVFAIGFGSGLFAVGTLTSAMAMQRDGHVGMALGAWGAVQATAAGLAVAAGGSLRDGVSALATQGWLGTVLQSPLTGYTFVYHVEMLMLFAALVALGPLVRPQSPVRHRPAREFGLAELPG
jgi:BCD family chlorophyll transporter-like MFS transporter